MSSSSPSFGTSLGARVFIYCAAAVTAVGWAFGCLYLIILIDYTLGLPAFESPWLYVAVFGVPAGVVSLTYLAQRAPHPRSIAACARRGFLWSAAACIGVVAVLVFVLGW